MNTNQNGSMWSSSLIFIFLVLGLISFSTASGAKSKSIPVTGGTAQANLRPPNSQAVTQVNTQPISGAYTIQDSDTLSSLALRFNTTPNALLRANPQISNPDQLPVGETLYLPGSTVVIDDQTIYIVTRGDDLFAIAARHNVTLAALEQANPQITDPRLIFPGQRVVIP